MKEEFLHYLWKYRLYDPDFLLDDNGDRITVISPGEYNRDAGPDFFNARIRLAGTEWAGNIEIHVLASHFYQHGHHLDQSFENVILHVVAEKDKPIFNSRNVEIPTTEIHFNPALYERYQMLLNNPLAVACQPYLKNIDEFTRNAWFTRISIERLEQKSVRIREILDKTGNDWEETLYRLISRYFGFKVNTDPFEILATELPFKIIRKHSDDRFQIEALLFGTAGMLEENLFPRAINDIYYLSLLKEYKILRSKYSLKPVHGWLWKFSRMRPANFPTLRISQLAGMLSGNEGLFSRIIKTESVKEIRSLFEVKASAYWDHHYIFGKPAPKSVKWVGDLAADMLIINAVVPILFTYGRNRDNQDLADRAIELLESVAPENNSVVRDWAAGGIDMHSAFSTQAAIHLRSEYCKFRKCIDCMFGTILIAHGYDLKKNDELTLEP